MFLFAETFLYKETNQKEKWNGKHKNKQKLFMLVASIHIWSGAALSSIFRLRILPRFRFL